MDREFALLHNLISIARIRVVALARDYRADEFIKGMIALYTEIKTDVFRGAFAGALLNVP